MNIPPISTTFGDDCGAALEFCQHLRQGHRIPENLTRFALLSREEPAAPTSQQVSQTKGVDRLDVLEAALRIQEQRIAALSWTLQQLAAAVVTLNERSSDNGK